MTATKREWFIRNVAEVPWREFPNHFGGALSKPLVMPETAGSEHIDYRISMYQPMAHVALHSPQGAGADLSRTRRRRHDGDRWPQRHVVRKHDVIFLPPGVSHSIANSGLVDLLFLVVTSPVSDDDRETRHREG